jgi:dUTP pyrophosphatase
MFVFVNPTSDSNILTRLLTIYDKIMVLKIFVDGDDELKQKYIEYAESHNNKIITNNDFIDAGFDLFAPGNEGDEGDSLPFFGPGRPNTNPVNKVDFKVCCSAQMFTDSGKTYNTGYYMYPRSSLSKTQLRLANATGIIDAGYRGHLMGMFDVVNINPNETTKTNDTVSADYLGKKYDRYLQICAPNLCPILVRLVNTKEELGEKTLRGDGGFGSTGR